MGPSCQVVADGLAQRGFLAVDAQPHAALLRLDDHRLLAEPAHHVEGLLRFPAQRELQDVRLDAAFDDVAEFLGDAEKAVRGAEAVQRLMRPPVIVMLYPQPDPLAGGVEAVELGAGQELLPDRLPEALDLPQGHRVVGPALEVVDPVLLELGLKARGAPPARELPALVGEQLLGDAVLGDGPAIDFEDVLRRLAAEDVEPHDIARVIVEEADEVGVLAAQAEGEDVGLPELVGGGALELAGCGRATRGLDLGLREQGLRVQLPAHRLPTDRQQAHAPEEVADLLDPEVGVPALHRDGLRLDRRRDLRLAGLRGPRLPLEARGALGAIRVDPLPQRAQAEVEILGNLRDREAFLHAELNCSPPELHRVDVRVRCAAFPLRVFLLP
jgi:hypothetical protein